MNHVKSILALLELSAAKHRRAMYVLHVLLFVTALLQVAGIASLAPFLAILSNPSLISENAVLNEAYVRFNFQSSATFLIAFAFTVMALITISNIVSAYTLWLSMKFTMHVNADIQKKMYANYLASDYVFFSKYKSSHLTSNLLHQVPRFTYMVLQPAINLSSQAMIAVLVVAGLFYVDYIIASTASIIIIGSYILLFRTLKDRLANHGVIITSTNLGIIKLLNESFGGIKEIKLRDNEQWYDDLIIYKIQQGLKSAAFISLAGDLPRFFVETVISGAILALAIYLIIQEGGSGNAISILGLYAIAGYKLMPAIQTIYKSASSIKANNLVATELFEEIKRTEPDTKTQSSNTPINSSGKEIKLNAVSYSYPESNVKALNDISLTITPYSITAFVGGSGAGKSTAADIILGLLYADEGKLIIDKTIIGKENNKNWQNNLSYVSQSIYIADDTIANNIIFGTEKGSINMVKVMAAAKKASIDSFIESLPKKYDTYVGEHGSQLSGGQKQRIGIARALYHDSNILIFDEATSALDNVTESLIMKEISRLSKSKTIIIIAHRLSTIVNADNIVFFDKGKIVAQGTFQWLLENNELFKTLVKSGEKKAC